jgi:outer membrane lipopolysaccharide assembly protein LptE/RlpB
MAPPAFFAGKTVKVAIFGNRTFKANLEAIVTNRVIEEMSIRHGVSIVNGDSDLVLSGDVITYRTDVVSYTGDDLVREYRGSMTVEAQLREVATQKLLWKGTFTESEIYPTNPNLALQQNAQDAAIREITRKLAQRIFLDVTRDF